MDINIFSTLLHGIRTCADRIKGEKCMRRKYHLHVPTLTLAQCDSVQYAILKKYYCDSFGEISSAFSRDEKISSQIKNHTHDALTKKKAEKERETHTLIVCFLYLLWIDWHRRSQPIRVEALENGNRNRKKKKNVLSFSRIVVIFFIIFFSL